MKEAAKGSTIEVQNDFNEIPTVLEVEYKSGGTSHNHNVLQNEVIGFLLRDQNDYLKINANPGKSDSTKCWFKWTSTVGFLLSELKGTDWNLKIIGPKPDSIPPGISEKNNVTIGDGKYEK